MRTLRYAAALCLALMLMPSLAPAAVPAMEVLPGDTFALGAPTYIDNVVLAAGTARTVTIPSFGGVFRRRDRRTWPQPVSTEMMPSRDGVMPVCHHSPDGRTVA